MHAFGLAGGVDGVEEDEFFFFCCCGFFASFFVFGVRGVAFDAVARCCGRSIGASEASFLARPASARLERRHGSSGKSLGRGFLVSFLVQREDGILLVLCRAGFLAQLGSTEEATGVAFAEVGSLAGT